MRLLHSSLCAVWLLMIACKGQETTLVPTPVTSPVSTTSPTVPAPPAIPRGTAPSGVDLYAQFAQPFSSLPDRRLKEINVFKDSALVASSTFMYSLVGLLASRTYLSYYNDGSASVRGVRYAYDGQGRLLNEANVQLKDPKDPTSEQITALTTYAYAGDRLAYANQKTPALSYLPGTLSLNAYTVYRYPRQDVREFIRLGYYSAVGTVNVTEPTDSTRQLLKTNIRLTTRTDSTWSILRIPGSPIQSFLVRRSLEETERDERGNATSIRNTVTFYSSETTQTTTTEQTYKHQYDGPGGLISSSVYPAYKLRYVFLYEPK